MKTLKRITLSLTWLGKIISIIVISLGTLVSIYLTAKVSYLVATQTHNGIFEMLDSTSLFLSKVMFISIFMIIIGAFSVLKTNSVISNLKIALR